MPAGDMQNIARAQPTGGVTIERMRALIPPILGTVLLACSKAATVGTPAAVSSNTLAPSLPAAATCERLPPVSVSPAIQDPEVAASQRQPNPSRPSGRCEVADSNLEQSKTLLLRSPQPGPQAAAITDWDHHQKPKNFERIAQRYALTTEEVALLNRSGFVALKRVPFRSFAWAYHDIYQSELPVFVSVDSILHAVYASNDKLLAQVEQDLLGPKLAALLDNLHCGLSSSASKYPVAVTKDLDVYLTVARSLLSGRVVPSRYGNEAEVATLLQRIKAAQGMQSIEFLGRPRMVDFSQFKPRGHYVKTENGDSLGNYFQAAMWLSRIEFNLVSHSSRSSEPGATPNPAETPHEALVAIALSDLVEQTTSLPILQELDRAWELFSGKREDVRVDNIVELRKQGKLTTLDLAATTQLRSLLGNRFPRTVRTHYMPEGSTELPTIFTLLGPRITPDTSALRPLTHSEVPGRHMLGAADIAYALGHDAAKPELTEELRIFPSLAASLDTARSLMQQERTTPSLYEAWLHAIRGLASQPRGQLPSFMTTEAFKSLRINSAIAAYGQLRHNNVLMAAQEYSEGGCQIPDGYVEPAPAVYDSLITYAARGEAVLTQLDPANRTGSAAYFRELQRTLKVLRGIAQAELLGLPLSEQQQRFLAMIAEMKPGNSGSGPTYTGWYFDLFRGRWEEALGDTAFVTDYFTSGQLGQVAYLGASQPHLALFVVDRGGPPRLMAGAVATAYSLVAPPPRLTDEEAAVHPKKVAPWATVYTANVPAAPPLSLTGAHEGPDLKLFNVHLRLPTGSPAATIEVLNHNFRPAWTKKVAAGGTQELTFPLPSAVLASAKALRIRVGEWSQEAPLSPMDGSVFLQTDSYVAPK